MAKSMAEKSADKFIKHMTEHTDDVLPFAAHYMDISETEEHDSLSWLQLNEFVTKLMRESYKRGFLDGQSSYNK